MKRTLMGNEQIDEVYQERVAYERATKRLIEAGKFTKIEFSQVYEEEKEDVTKHYKKSLDDEGLKAYLNKQCTCQIF